MRNSTDAMCVEDRMLQTEEELLVSRPTAEERLKPKRGGETSRGREQSRELYEENRRRWKLLADLLTTEFRVFREEC